MKKTKDKSVKKTVRDDIKLKLVKGLTTLTTKLGGDAEKLDKEIGKVAKLLAKKISKEIKTEEPIVPAAVPVAEKVPATEAAPVAKAAKVKSSKPKAVTEKPVE